MPSARDSTRGTASGPRRPEHAGRRDPRDRARDGARGRMRAPDPGRAARRAPPRRDRAEATARARSPRRGRPARDRRASRGSRRRPPGQEREVAEVLVADLGAVATERRRSTPATEKRYTSSRARPRWSASSATRRLGGRSRQGVRPGVYRVGTLSRGQDVFRGAQTAAQGLSEPTLDLFSPGSARKWSSEPLRKQGNRGVMRFRKPSAGLEPATPSLPSARGTSSLVLRTCPYALPRGAFAAHRRSQAPSSRFGPLLPCALPRRGENRGPTPRAQHYRARRDRISPRMRTALDLPDRREGPRCRRLRPLRRAPHPKRGSRTADRVPER